MRQPTASAVIALEQPGATVLEVVVDGWTSDDVVLVLVTDVGEAVEGELGEVVVVLVTLGEDVVGVDDAVVLVVDDVVLVVLPQPEIGTCTHCPPSQASVVHASPSLQAASAAGPSITPSQSSSTPLQTSGAPGCTAGSLSLQSSGGP